MIDRESFCGGVLYRVFHGLTLDQSLVYMRRNLATWPYVFLSDFSVVPRVPLHPVYVIICKHQCGIICIVWVTSHIVTVNMCTSLSVNISYCRTSACAYQRSLSSHFLISPGVSMRMDAWLGCIRAGCWVFHSLCTWQRVRTVRMIEERCMQSELVDLLLRLYWTGDEVLLWTLYMDWSYECVSCVPSVKKY